MPEWEPRAGPVAEVACAVCADGPLLAGELATGAARHRADAWLVGHGWHSDTTGGVTGERVVLCPRCAPIASTTADAPGTVSEPAGGGTACGR